MSHAIVSCVGSVTKVRVQLAGASEPGENIVTISGDLEIVALSGVFTGDGPHLHVAVSDRNGKVFAGHLLPGSAVDTTAEVVLVNLGMSGIFMTRQMDKDTNEMELVVRRGLGWPRRP
jgi:predicted DNA-binding protein with PD1-like motif